LLLKFGIRDICHAWVGTDVYACALQRPTAQTHDVYGDDDEDDDGDDDEGDADNDEDKESVSARVCMDVSVCVWFCMCVYIPTSLVNIKLKKIRFLICS
jgi:hypothetical protein